MPRHGAQRAFALLWQVLTLAAFVYCLYRAGKDAYKIRLYAIKTYGRVIHEVRSSSTRQCCASLLVRVTARA